MKKWSDIKQIFLLPIILITSTSGFEIDNGVVGKPEVYCGIDTIRVKLNTEHVFKGRIYVDGESDKSQCVQHSESDQHSTQDFSVPIGACNMRRQRTLHPRGISFSFTMIVSFHPFFVTGMDRAFSIRCFFLESIKGLNAEIDVGTLAPQSIDQEYSLPVCAYHLKEGIEGHVLRFAQVGQKVTHVWRCDQDASHVYGILIHSCYADDGRGNKFELVDDRGCSTDPFLLPQIEYESGAISAYTNAHVFKYADKVQLYFTCTVQLCYKHDGGCEGITPPQCSGSGPAGSSHGPASGSGGPHSEGPYFPHSSASQERPDSYKQQPQEGNGIGIDQEGSRAGPQGPPQQFLHLPQGNLFGSPNPSLPAPSHGGEGGGAGPFQPIFLGPSNAEGFNKGDIPHSVSPFKGPKDLASHQEPSPYRRDSPINETEEDIVVQGVTLRTTVSIPQSSSSSYSTAELVTFKPVSTSNTANVNTNTNSEEEGELITTHKYREDNLLTKSTTPATSSSTKVRRRAGEMETDVSVDVIVLPVEDKERKDSNVPPQSLSFSSSAEVCLSRTSTVIFFTAILLGLFCCCTVTFFVTRQRNRNAIQHAKRRLETF